MSGEEVVVASADIEEALQLAGDLIQVAARDDCCNIAMLVAALGLMTGDAIYRLERGGLAVPLDTLFAEMRRIAEMHIEACRRQARASSLDCAGTA